MTARFISAVLTACKYQPAVLQPHPRTGREIDPRPGVSRVQLRNLRHMAHADILQASAHHSDELPYNQLLDKPVLPLESRHVQLISPIGAVSGPATAFTSDINSLSLQEIINQSGRKPLVISRHHGHLTNVLRSLSIYLIHKRKYLMSYLVSRVIILIVGGIRTVSNPLPVEIALYVAPIRSEERSHYLVSHRGYPFYAAHSGSPCHVEQNRLSHIVPVVGDGDHTALIRILGTHPVKCVISCMSSGLLHGLSVLLRKLPDIDPVRVTCDTIFTAQRLNVALVTIRSLAAYHVVYVYNMYIYSQLRPVPCQHREQAHRISAAGHTAHAVPYAVKHVVFSYILKNIFFKYIHTFILL